jgi:NAD(P)-dependent dehydrogenase (short-subunit alcohol dehydrogenase family)
MALSRTLTSLFSLEGRTALVTGGARGVGAMCAEALVDAGATVIVTSRDSAAAEETRKRLSTLGNCHAIQVDLLAEDGVAALGAALADRVEGLDILVNNAGVTWGARLEDYPSHAWSRVLGLDVAVPFQVAQSVLGLLRAAATAERPARIVNIGSVDGHAVGSFDNYAYAAAKAALHHLTRVLAVRLGDDHVTVNCIAPGPIRTDMTAGILEEAESRLVESSGLHRLCRPEDVAGALVYLTSRAGSFVTGAVLPVDGGAAIATWGGR